jgi:hypothetical protein
MGNIKSTYLEEALHGILICFHRMKYSLIFSTIVEREWCEYYIHISSSYYAKAQLVGGIIFGTNMLEESYLLVCILRLRQKKDMYTHTRIIFMRIHPQFLLG